MNAVVMASGSGTNFEALMEKQKAGLLDVTVQGLIVDKEGARARERARRLGVEERWFDPKAYENKAAYEKAILEFLKEKNIDLIILAGYMRIVGDTLLQAYPNRIVNIHPAMLPAFPGAHAIADAYNAGVETTGVTVHLIDEQIDNGPIILQEEVAIDSSWTLEELESAVHAKEYDLFYRAINKVAHNLKQQEEGKSE